MSNLSDFLGGAGGGGGLYLGYIETADGTFEKIANGAGVAVLDYSNGPVALSTDGGNPGSAGVWAEQPYLVYENGLWACRAGAYSAGIENSFPPATSPDDIAIDPSTGNLISCSSDTYLIYIHDGISSTILSSFASPGTTPNALTVDPQTGNLISHDISSSTIYIHDGISGAILNSFSSESSFVSGLAVDATSGNLISHDRNTKKTIVHSGISGSVFKSFIAPIGFNGLDFDPFTKCLLGINFLNGKIYVLDGIGATIIQTITLPSASSASGGVAINSITGSLVTAISSEGIVYTHANLRKFALALTEATA